MNYKLASKIITAVLTSAFILSTQYQIYLLQNAVNNLQVQVLEEGRYRRQDTARIWIDMSEESQRRQRDVSQIWNHMSDEPSRK